MNGLNICAADSESDVMKKIREFDQYKPYCPINLNGNHTHALIDSGNQVVNAISEKFARKIFGDKFQENIKPFHSSVGTAQKGQGYNLQILGIVRNPMRLRLGGLNRNFRTKPIVIRNFSTDMNIGGPFLTLQGIDHLHSIGCLRVLGKLIELSSNPRRKPSIEVQAMEEQMERARPSLRPILKREVKRRAKEAAEISHAYVAETRVIPPNEAIFLKLRVPDVERRKLQPGEGLMKAENKFQENARVIPAICAMVRTDDDGNTYTSVMNNSDDEVEIKEGRLYGTYHPRVIT